MTRMRTLILNAYRPRSTQPPVPPMRRRSSPRFANNSGFVWNLDRRPGADDRSNRAAVDRL